jgi:hypothetical protein
MNLVFEHFFAAPPENLFAFHERPDNLAVLQRGWKNFKLASHPGSVRLGGILRVAERIGPFWLTFSFEHFVFEPPRRFGERMVKGPFKRFEHIHEFKSQGSGTLLKDILDFELPFYLGGPLADKWIVAPKLRRWFTYRHAELTKIIAQGLLNRVTS